jgi:phosphoenolpyruvate---glycerone phosphotransferase subunit DhaK
MKRTKKILNDPAAVAAETMEGLVLASDGRTRKMEDQPVLLRQPLPKESGRRGKVGLLVGGGSGHEPLYSGLVGAGLADAAVCGQVFAAPSPDAIAAATRAIDDGRGVLYVYGNYAGDVMNFDMGAELAEEDGITVRTVRGRDDVAAAPPERLDDRRGVAGCLLVMKIAGAAAETCDSLDEVYRIATKAEANTRSIGVAVSAGSIPETGTPTFEIGDDEIEIGMGAHGEPGVSRQKIGPADAIVDQMMATLLPDLPFKSGDEVALLINNLGSSTMMELLIANRRIRKCLDDAGIRVYLTEIGPYLTTQEMAGFSITLMRLDDELKRHLDAPARSVAFSRN